MPYASVMPHRADETNWDGPHICHISTQHPQPGILSTNWGLFELLAKPLGVRFIWRPVLGWSDEVYGGHFPTCPKTADGRFAAETTTSADNASSKGLQALKMIYITRNKLLRL